VISELVSLASHLFKGWTESKKAKSDLKLAEIQAKKDIILSKETANSEWEIAQLTDKDKVLRWAAFVLFASPLIAGLISPSWGAWVAQGWSSLPSWQSNVLSGMCLAVFGLKKIPQLVGSTVSAVKDALVKPKL